MISLIIIISKHTLQHCLGDVINVLLIAVYHIMCTIFLESLFSKASLCRRASSVHFNCHWLGPVNGTLCTLVLGLLKRHLTGLVLQNKPVKVLFPPTHSFLVSPHDKNNGSIAMNLSQRRRL